MSTGQDGEGRRGGTANGDGGLAGGVESTERAGSGTRGAQGGDEGGEPMSMGTGGGTGGRGRGGKGGRMVSRTEGLSSQDLRKQVENIKDDLSLLRSDLADMMKDLVSGGSVEAGAAREKAEAAIRERMDRLSEMASDLTERAKSTGRDAMDTIEQQAKDKPIQTLALALGVGVVLGAMLRR